MKTALLALLLLALLLPPASAQPQSNCRFYLAGQYDWDAKVGFYLDFEGADLAALPIILGVADGENWRFPRHLPGFEFDRDYHLRAVIAPDRAQLFLDGSLVIDSPGAWRPAPGPLELNHRPPWANEPGDWLASVSDLTIAVNREGQEVILHHLADVNIHPALRLFEQSSLTRTEFNAQPGDTITILATLRFVRSDLHAWAPMIDPYGQCRYADFPGKVLSDQDLTADIAAEDARLAHIPPSADFDQYGGYRSAGWQEQPTGFFRTLQRDARWWLISPDGNPCFYLGVCLLPATHWPRTPVTGREQLFEWLPPRQGVWSDCWSRDSWGRGEDADYVCLYTSNLVRKYGEQDWQTKAADRALRRLRAWAFSGGGKWGAPDSIVSTPVLYLSTTPRLVRHPDIFDPAIREQFRQELADLISPRREDPNVLGWSFESEYDALITRDEIRGILAKPSETPSKRALLDYAVDEMCDASLADLAHAWDLSITTREQLYAAASTPPDDDIERLRCWYADRFYHFVYTTIKDIDPNHLYLAPWIVPGWWESEQDWHIQARHCDVIGYDRYFMQYQDDLLSRFQDATDKPTLCGEFSFPQFYRGARGFGRYWSSRVEDEAEAGDLYHQAVQAAARDPHCLGMIWFHYRDQPLTGRGEGFGPDLVYGEHHAFGLVTETDRVKWPLVTRMRQANLQAARWRLEAPL